MALAGLACVSVGGLPTVSEADTTASRQRVTINAVLRQKQFPAWSGTYQLTALTRGRLTVDKGTLVSAGASATREGSRDGQNFTADTGVDDLKSKAGTIRLRWRQTIVSAGRLHSVATGTWRVVGGTGLYAGATGNGRVAAVIGEATHVGYARYEGFVSVP